MKVFGLFLLVTFFGVAEARTKIHNPNLLPSYSGVSNPQTESNGSSSATSSSVRGVQSPASSSIPKQAVNFIDVEHRTRAPSMRVGNTPPELIRETQALLKEKTDFTDTSDFGPPNTRLTNCRTERSGDTRCDLSINGNFVSSGILNLPSDNLVQTLAGRAKHPSKNGVSFGEVMGGLGVNGVYGFTPDQPVGLNSQLQVQPEDYSYYYPTDKNTQDQMGLNQQSEVVSPGDPQIATILFRFPSGSGPKPQPAGFKERMSGKSAFSGGEISMQGGGGGMDMEPPV